MKTYIIYLSALLIIAFSACREDDLEAISDVEEEIIDPTETYEDWTETTHSNTADPDYSIVFNQNEVLRFDIKISSSNWTKMQADLAANLGSSSRPGGGPGGGVTETSDYDPIWVPCSFNFNNTEWYNVGVRYKGNSSLKSAYNSGNNKLSFKLDFDEFEDDYPALKNQRFYGFKQLNLNNNFDDASLMREKMASDLFRQFGLTSSQTTFCAVYVDNGSGSKYYGLYTLVEEMDDTVLGTQLGDDSGNLYKPDGTAASFAQGSYNDSEMEKKNNEDLNDYSDVEALYNAINNSSRTSDIEAWKSELEGIFDVDGFMKWLAANTVIQNWDTYGRMTHNYYLYNNHNTNLLTWIPWDNNEAFQVGKQGGALSLGLSEVGSGWPLIKYLIDAPEYKTLYDNYLLSFINTVFIPTDVSNTYDKHYNLIKEYAYSEVSGYTFIGSDAAFDNAVDELKSHVTERNNAVVAFLED